MDDSKAKSSENAYSHAGIIYERRHGDVIIWKQIIEHAKCASVKKIILITDENKEDWWWTFDSMGQKKIGPRPELIEEIRREAQVEFFHMYSSENFLKYAREQGVAGISSESISSVGDVNKINDFDEIETKDSIRITNHAVRNLLRTNYPDCKITLQPGKPDYIVTAADGSVLLGLEYSIHFSEKFASTHLDIEVKKLVKSMNDKNVPHVDFFIIKRIDEPAWTASEIASYKKYKSIPKNISVKLARLRVDSDPVKTEIVEITDLSEVP